MHEGPQSCEGKAPMPLPRTSQIPLVHNIVGRTLGVFEGKTAMHHGTESDKAAIHP